MNNIILYGHIGRDPDFRVFDSGTQKCTTTLAVKRIFAKEPTVDWFQLELWGKQAELAQNFLKKGSAVVVQGSCIIDKYTNKEGNPAQQVKIKVQQFQMTHSKSSQNTTAPKKEVAPYEDDALVF